MHPGMKYTTLILICTIALGMISCESDISDTGREILPDSEQLEIQFTDTLSLDLKSEIRGETETGQQPNQLLGTYRDPVFGEVSASIFTQVSRETNLWDFSITLSDEADELVIVDSVILTFAPDSINDYFYGEFNSAFDVEVFEITPGTFFPEPEDATSRTNVDVINVNLCPTPEDCRISFRTRIDFDTVFNFSLDRSLGEKLIFADSSVFETEAIFSEFFTGLALKVPNSSSLGADEIGAIYSMNLSRSETGISVFYRIRPTATSRFVDTVAIFPIKSTNRKFHQISRETDPAVHLLAQTISDTSMSDDFLFIQQGDLVGISGTIPDLSSFGRRIGINRAELIIRVDTSFIGLEVPFDPPQSQPLFASGTPDLLLEFLSDEGETLLASQGQFLEDLNIYIFDVTNYTQDLNLGLIENNEFFIRPFAPGIRVNRAVIGGSAHPDLSPTFNLTFTSQQ